MTEEDIIEEIEGIEEDTEQLTTDKKRFRTMGEKLSNMCEIITGLDDKIELNCDGLKDVNDIQTVKKDDQEEHDRNRREIRDTLFKMTDHYARIRKAVTTKDLQDKIITENRLNEFDKTLEELKEIM